MALSALSLLTVGARAQAQSGAGSAAARDARVIRIYATPDGESHFEDLTISPDARPIDITQMTASVYRGSGTRTPDWHTAPRKQFAINMAGELEVEITNGVRRKIGVGDLVYLEDLTGKGHVTRQLSPVSNLFLHVPEAFDVVAWAAGK
jgi:hypothetical protein